MTCCLFPSAWLMAASRSPSEASGNSPNVLKGIEAAKSLGMTTIAWTGGSGGKLAGLADYAFVVPSTVTARIQESHITLAHVLCELIEDQVLANQA